MSRFNRTLVWRWGLAVAAALLLGTVSAQAAELVESRAVRDPSAAIRALLNGAAITTRLTHWGLSVADVQMDVDAMSPSQRARLYETLARPWPATGDHGQADLQARYLVMVSLMRESNLFARVIRSFR